MYTFQNLYDFYNPSDTTGAWRTAKIKFHTGNDATDSYPYYVRIDTNQKVKGVLKENQQENGVIYLD